MKKYLYILFVFLLIFGLLFYIYKNNRRVSYQINSVLCKIRGGKWGVWRDLPSSTSECNLPTTDAGKECDDSSQCQSYCQAIKGSEKGSNMQGNCYRFKMTICMQSVNNGIVGSEWCY